MAAAPKVPPPSPIYVNLQPIEPPTIPPQIDAVIFDNRSLFNVANSAFAFANPTLFLLTGSSADLYQGQSVLYWTNTGSMIGAPGFKFDTYIDPRRLTPAQRRRRGALLPKPSSAFVNQGDISVNAQLFIHSTNISNPGRLEGDLGARITLLATNGTADLTRGTIREGRVLSGAALDPLLFFGIDPELFILEAATGTNGVYNRTNGPPLFLPSAFISTLGFPGSTNSFGGGFVNFYETLVNPTLGGQPVTTRITNFSSQVPNCGGSFGAFAQVTDFGLGFGKDIAVCFVETNSLIETNIKVDVRFLTNFFFGSPTIAVQWQSTDFDIINQRVETNVITLIDDGFISPMRPPTNVLEAFPSPFNYSLIRGRVAGFDQGSPGNSNYNQSIFFDPTFDRTSVFYDYSAVSWQVGATNLFFFSNATNIFSPFLITVPVGISPALTDPTNYPSRIEVSAKNLNLDHTRIRAEQVVDIRAKNLTSNTLATVDAPFVNFDVGTTMPNLTIANLAPAVVNRAHGQVSAYSADWTATITTVITNFGINFTNVEPVHYHVLVVGNCLQFSQPVVLHRFSVQAANLTIEDNLLVNNSAKIDSESLTIGTNGSLQLPARNSWAFTNIQNVTHFTNFGLVNVPGAGAFFGTVPSGYPLPQNRRARRKLLDRVNPYDEFVNRGVVIAATESIAASQVENSGTLFSPAVLIATNGPVLITANSITVSNAILSAGQNVELHGNDVVLRNSFISAGRTNLTSSGSTVITPGILLLDATNSLGDAGTTFSNQIVVTGGVTVRTRPQFAGDFLASSVFVKGGVVTDSRVTWAGDDRGPVVEGYTDNLALGRLTLDGGTGQGAIGNFFSFHGIGGSNAIYVDYLELLNFATNFNFALGVDPDFTIYFADSNVPAEKLDETGGGRIRWVSQFTGPQSSTNILYPNGQTYTFNAALVRSHDLDSDNDGFVNAEDCTPIQVVGFDSALVNCPPTTDGAKTFSAREIDLRITMAARGQGVALNWVAAADSLNRVEFSDAIAGGRWQTLTNFINGPVNARVTVRDAAGGPLRVYRVRVDAGKR